MMEVDDVERRRNEMINKERALMERIHVLEMSNVVLSSKIKIIEEQINRYRPGWIWSNALCENRKYYEYNDEVYPL